MKIFLTFLLLAASLHAAPKPNIIFIVTNDLGLGNGRCYGADHYQPPHVSKLASGGIRFMHGYTASLCGPSRALGMTGR